MVFHKAIVVITGMADCFHDYLYTKPILFLWDLSILCVVKYLWPFIISLAWHVEHFFVHCYKQFIKVHYVPKYMSCHKAIVVKVGRTHCLHDYIYVMPIMLLWDLSSLSAVDHLWQFVWYSFQHSLVHWQQQFVNIHHVLKCMSCHKAIVVLVWRKHCFHDYIYIIPILLL